ncbi:2Fe-2S iron-sulfur cluster-binding protein [Chromobacterium sp. S0633]|uniref:2Fe-2S iron-sulfur cluster-binding protein n=1 Tax=Chromobacterium sp. S0633 TaxID=2957805 RepID=UPI00209D60CF|nr:2Fe-2S iron-sulfur cluster-binding protein [Chromobacterium sp. S0633]MCP1291119.1 2Fe-2S iron-sulfur cluster-binding protein [Chromobacterium sp. S0633]
MPQFYPLQLTEIQRDTPDSLLLTLEPSEEHRDRFRHEPGQHLTLRAWLDGEEVRRSYSLCNAPDAPKLQLAIKRVAGGRFSQWAHDSLGPGAMLEALPPSGRFGLPAAPETARHYAGFAAGSGITPVLSILQATLLREPLSRFTLVYCNRNLASLQFRETLATLKDRYPARLSLIYLFSAEEQDIELFNGRLDRERCLALLRGCLPAASIDHAYVCGPAGMMAAVSQALSDSGLPPERVRSEHYAAAPAAGPARAERALADSPERVRVTVRMDGMQRQVELGAPVDNLLDALLQAGVTPRYSCKAGVCATCRCQVLAGEVDMEAPHALAPEEVAAGYVLSCRSRPLTSTLALSFD